MEPKINDEKKINRLIIVGNGFDISLGLETRYKDFLYNYLKTSYIKVYTDVENNTIRTEVDLKTQTYNFTDGLIELKCPENDTSYTIKGPLNQLKDYDTLSDYLINNNILKYKFELLKRFHQNSEQGRWTDLEVLYYETLVTIVRRFLDDSKREIRIEEYNIQFNLLRTKLIEYLSSVKLSTVINNKLDKVLFYCDNFFDNLLIPRGQNQSLGDIMFLTFNYTYSIEDLLRLKNKSLSNIEINHIHGNLKYEDSVIFGFGNEQDSDFQFLESIQSGNVLNYIKSNHYFQSSNFTKLNSFINKGEFEVFTLGHSCSVSDKTLLNSIFENVNCNSIRVMYRKKKNSKYDHFDLTSEILRLSNDREKLKTKILSIVEDDEIFQLKDMN